MRLASKLANMHAPAQGSKALSYTLDFSTVGKIAEDVFQEMAAAGIEFLQSVFIDNSQNSANFTLTTYIGDTAIGLVAQAFSQGYYPVLIDVGTARFVAATSQGIKIPIAFLNVPMPYFTWGPVPGVTVTPALTNIPINFAPLAVGDNQLVAGIAAETIKAYRLLLVFGGGANIQFFTGPSADNEPLTGVMDMFAGGSIMLQASGIPWLTTDTADQLTLNSSAGVNCGGMLGYVQS